MPSLLSTTDLQIITGIYVDHFPTFNREIVVFKEPKVTITNINNPILHPGYRGTSQTTTNTTYTFVSGVYNGILSYDRDQKIEPISEAQVGVSKGRAKLKVQQNAYDYIKNGKTENIQVDGLKFNVISDEGVQNFFGLRYYYFILEQTS